MRAVRIVTLLGLLLAGPAFGAEAPYLTAKQLDLTIMLPPPPAKGSALEAAEIAAVVAAQRAASPERIALGAKDAEEDVFTMFTVTLGEKFVAGNLPVASGFFARVGDSEDETVDPAKKVFARVRPWMASSEVKVLGPSSKSGSWPSGHTTRVTMEAIILAAMVPEKKEAIWARAAQYAESRVIIGMHYPLDLEVGRRAGTAMAAVMFADAAFRADFERAKAEVRRVLGM
jgi:acid phosphatase (class A)